MYHLILHLPFPLLLSASAANFISKANGCNLVLAYTGVSESKYSKPLLQVASVELVLSCRGTAKRNTVISGKQTYLHVMLLLVLYYHSCVHLRGLDESSGEGL